MVRKITTPAPAPAQDDTGTDEFTNIEATVEDFVPPRAEKAAKPNPFAAIVASLPDLPAGKGKTFRVPTAKLGRVRRLLTLAGDAVEPPVSVMWAVKKGETESVVTVSSRPKIRQDRKAKDSDEKSE